MRGETEWTGFQTIHFPLRKIHMDSFRIFSNLGPTILFKKKNISALYSREQKNYGGIAAKTASIKYFFFSETEFFSFRHC
jgi:hypothetical protein